jgi:hypothetical protein
MLYVGYGQPKSGSTFVTQVIARIIFAHSGSTVDEIRGRYLPEQLRANFQQITGARVHEIDACFPPDVLSFVKTHAPLDETIADMVASGAIMACASFRDPRDVALSLLDVGARDRARGVDRPAFTSLYTIEDTLRPIRRNLKILRAWLKLPNVLPIPYDMILRRPDLVATHLIRQLGLEGLDGSAIVRPLLDDTSLIPEFNKGIAGRYKTEMSAEHQALFADMFGGDIAMIQELTGKVAAEAGMDPPR